jgi:choline dehydrogenase-like flavoprotein
VIIDARHLEAFSSTKSEICVIGGGVAGITLALQLEEAGFNVILLESGGYQADDETQDLYRGESTGTPYRFADGARSRFLGGSSNCWGGWCRPLEEDDFSKRPWVPNSGWPFSRTELEPYYEAAHPILQLGPPEYSIDYWVRAIGRPHVRRLPFNSAVISDGISQFSPPTRFGRLYRQRLRRSTLIKVYLWANVVNIETDGAETIRTAHARTLDGKMLEVQARVFVLACGGIENARILLVSNKQRHGGLGNHEDLVGRYFMDHPRMYSARLQFTQAWSRNVLYDIKFNYHSRYVAAQGTSVAAQFWVNPHTQRAEKLLNARVCFDSVLPGEGSKGAEALVRIKHRLDKREQLGCTLADDLLSVAAHPFASASFLTSRFLPMKRLLRYSKFQIIVEPVPDPSSRVTLCETRDRLGINRVQVHWRPGDLVKHTIDRTLAIVTDDLTRAGVAKIRPDPPINGGNWPSAFEEEGCWHHMGTTRMDDCPRRGVVDRNLRVHGTNNLYLAGSSVFPTGGSNFPTMTIVALSLRLATHLKTVVGTPLRACLERTSPEA